MTAKGRVLQSGVIHTTDIFFSLRSFSFSFSFKHEILMTIREGTHCGIHWYTYCALRHASNVMLNLRTKNANIPSRTFSVIIIARNVASRARYSVAMIKY